MSQRIPAHQLNIVLIHRLSELVLSEIRMCFHLDKLRSNFPRLLQFGNVFSFKIGDTDGFCLAFSVCLFQLPVSGKPVPRRLMDVQQIYVINAQPLQSFFHCMIILILSWPEFCGNENIFPLQTAVFDPSPAGSFIHICIRRINKRITHLKRFSYTVFCFCRRKHEGADPYHRTFYVIVQDYVFHVRSPCKPLFTKPIISGSDRSDNTAIDQKIRSGNKSGMLSQKECGSFCNFI